MKQLVQVSAGIAGVVAASALLAPSAFAADGHLSADTNAVSSGTATVGEYVNANNSEADTKVYLQADSSKIVASVPSEVHVKVSGDGTFICPAKTATAAKNGSIFQIHIEQVKMDAANSFTLGGSTGNDLVTYNLAPDTGTAISAIVGGTTNSVVGWNIAKSANLNIAHTGSIASVSKDLAADQQFATIHWLFAAGADA
jgi:hypothetical protein